jgi:hypothetical protein
MTRSAAEVEAEVEASRDELDRDVEALRQKMTPGQLFDEATRTMGGAGQQVASKFLEQAKENPMPLAVMGLGLAWLMSSSNKSGRQERYSSGYSGETRSFGARSYDGSEGGGLREKAHEIGEKASDMISGAREKLSAGTGSIGEGGRAAVQNLSSMARPVANRAREVGYQAQRSFTDTLEREPLLIGAVGLVVGAAVGLALPPTPVENRLVGPMRDRLANKGKDLAQTGLEQASSAAQAAYEGVKSELQQGGEGDERDLSEKVEGAARKGVKAAQEDLKSSAPH